VDQNRDAWQGVVFDGHKIPRKGRDLAADKASSDDNAVVDPEAADAKPKSDSFCVVM
jgi:hypothetical protein